MNQFLPGDLAEASSFLQAHMPEEVSRTLNWSTLKLLERSFVDMERVAKLLDSLSSLPPSGGISYVRIFVLYILATQEPEAAQSFREVLRQHAPGVGDHLMTYARELLKEGEIKAEVRIIENLLREGMEWAAIERVTSVNEAQFQALKRQVEDMNE